MFTKYIIGIVFAGFLIWGCSSNTTDSQKEIWKAEIVKMEKDFCNAAINKGIKEAFLEFADTSAVLMRNNKLIIGKKAIHEYLNKPSEISEVKLIWEPDFVDVSNSGDMAYTYGKFEMSYVDADGKIHKNAGVFHTVWKKNAVGEWKYVWD